jgi:RNA polymerase sigma-70 factor (ECF subfamily)
LAGAQQTGSVRIVAWHGSDAELIALAGRGGPRAAAAVYDRFGADLNRLVRRVLGHDAEHDDVVHDCFVNVLKGVAGVRDPDALQGWVVSVTLNAVRSHLRRRRVRRLFWADEPAPADPVAAGPDHEARELLTKVYRILDHLPSDERIAFVLRYLEQRPLVEVAELCACSLATIKRRIARADQRFARRAARVPALAERLGGSERRSKHVAV